MTKQDETYRPGDVVRLKSDGRPMEVKGEGFVPELVECEWTDEGGTPHALSLHPGMIERVPKRRNMATGGAIVIEPEPGRPRDPARPYWDNDGEIDPP